MVATHSSVWENIGFLLYPGFEPLDVYGPLEILGSLTKPPLNKAKRIVTIAEEAGHVESALGTQTVATHGLADAPFCNILVIPGGIGSRVAMHNSVLLDWIRRRYEDPRLEYLVTVCTGTTLLLRNDLLLGCRATTNKMMYKYISQLDDRVTWVKRARWVEDGRLLTTSGVSAGMDGALYLIAKRFGDEAASAIASYIEYSGNWQDGDEDPFEVAIEAK